MHGAGLQRALAQPVLQMLHVRQHRRHGPRLSLGQIGDQLISSMCGCSFSLCQHTDLQTIAVNALHAGQSLRAKGRLRPSRFIQSGLQIGRSHHAPVQQAGPLKVLDEICAA